MLPFLSPFTRRPERLAPLVLLLPPLLLGLLTTLGPLRLDPVAMWGGVGVGHHPGWLPGFPSIDPNMGTTSFALGFRAARDVLSGHLPLWNHYEGLGAPLLGEMQSAALFPPTWLLLLPGGQAIEHAFLQAVAGLGTFLFLRRFGLGTAAALAGGLLFEFNGVFAWLRNAVFNPVAFLPWLFWAIEGLFRFHRGEGEGGRARPLCGGALAAALSLYAGFPEVVYFYALLLAAWAALRGLSLPRRRALAFAADLLALAALALLLAAPVLLAFAHVLREGVVGGHHGTEFHDHVLPLQALLLTLLPYAFGPVSGVSQPGLADIWGNLGGYFGLVPFLLAAAGLACTPRRATSWLLALWVVLAVGASHGVPLLHGAFIVLPLTGIAAFCRYLDAGWIFAGTVLAAIFIDQVATAPPVDRRRAVALAAVAAVALLGLATAAAWPMLAALLRHGWDQARFVLVSAAAGALLLVLFLGAARLRRPTLPLAALAIVEAVACFMLPYASTPHFAGVDRALIDFLRGHAGFARFALAGGGLGPNFGSVFNIPSMNYDDLPSPARTARFVNTRLDPTTDGVIFGGNEPPADEADRRVRRARFLSALDGYRAAGVRYVLSPDDFDADPAYPLDPGDSRPVPLRDGDEVVLDLDNPTPARQIAAVSVLLGTYGGTPDGSLRLQLCQASRCVNGTAPLSAAPDNRSVLVPLDAELALQPGAPLRLSLARIGGRRPLALWMRPAAGPGTHLAGLPAPAAHRPVIEWIGPAEPRPLLRTPTTTVFELTNPRPYASAPACQIDVAAHDRMQARCTAPSRLLRLEVLMEGWSARVNGADTPITPVEDTFQAINLPAGDSVIEFTYAPRFLHAALLIALATLALCLAVLARPIPRRA